MIKYKKEPFISVVILLMTVWTFISVSVSTGQEPPPRVDVGFSIDASDFKENLPELQATENRLAEFIAAQCRAHFPFLRWRRAGSSTESGHRLQLTLTEKPASPLSQVVLLFSGMVEGNPIDLPAIAELPVYSPFDMDRPTHNPRDLERAVQQKLGDRFINESFRDKLHNFMLKGVPLSRRVVVDEIDQRIIVPIEWESLKADDKSVLKVDFVGGGRSMRLSSVQKRRHEPNLGTVQCAVQSLDFPPILIVGLGNWHKEIPHIFSGEIGLTVLMETYVERVNLYTEHGLVTRPE